MRAAWCRMPGVRRSLAKAWTTGAILSACALATVTVRAQVEPIRLTYSAHGACPTEEQFVERVRMHIVSA